VPRSSSTSSTYWWASLTGRVRRAERRPRRFSCANARAGTRGIDEHQRHVRFGLHRQRLAVGDVHDHVGARAGGIERRAVRPIQPYSLPLLGAAVCQNDADEKCENDGWS
jgi:hypothetical protein